MLVKYMFMISSLVAYYYNAFLVSFIFGFYSFIFGFYTLAGFILTQIQFHVCQDLL